MTAPLYAKVKEHILGHIRSGAWTPGMRVPSENELVESFSISRMTANRARSSDGNLAAYAGLLVFGYLKAARDAAGSQRRRALYLTHLISIILPSIWPDNWAASPRH